MLFVEWISKMILPLAVLVVIFAAVRKKADAYGAFVSGVNESLEIICDIFPNVFALMIAIGMFRESGLAEFITSLLKPVLKPLGIPSEIVPAAILRPLSGSGSLALLSDILKSHNPDSLIGIMACVIIGSTETTFYTVAVYMGAAEIRDSRYAIKSALVADFVSIATGIAICLFMF